MFMPMVYELMTISIITLAKLYLLILFISDCEEINKDLDIEVLRAIRQNDLENLQTLIENCADINAVVPTFGNTALMFAAQNGNEDIVDYLLSKNADVNAKSIDGFTALIVAANVGYRSIVEKLLSAGADVCAKTDELKTAIDYADPRNS